MNGTNESKPTGPSRGEVETLLLLDAVGASGCYGIEVAGKLGLSPTLANTVAEGLEPLVLEQLLHRAEDGKITLTDKGATLLRDRLSGLGIRR